jgi:UDP-N-acetylmuramoylalanine--D-glutamate ligase
MGREGRAVLGLLGDPARCAPASVVTVDDGARETSGAERAAVDLSGVDVIIKSPGVRKYRPELVAFEAAGGVVTGLTAMVLAEREGLRTVGVTGTKGKSTTASLVAHLLAAANVPVELAGNIGRPAAEVLDEREKWLVLECSSYQSADVTVSPVVGVFTSIYEEHLDWHGTYERYVSDKLALFASSDVVFVNGMQPALVELSQRIRRRQVVTDADALLPLDGLRLQGEHNRRNANLAVHAAAMIVGDIHPAFAHALTTFEPLEHRLHTLGWYGGLMVVDDVLATAPEAVLHALDVFADRPVTVLVGGYDREIDYRTFGAALLLRPTVRVIAMGPAGRRVADEMERAGAARPLTVGSLPEAVDAVDPAERGVLLLSPGATSYGEFADYRARSAAFRQLLVERGMTPA